MGKLRLCPHGLLVFGMLLMISTASAQDVSIGGGVYYQKTLGDIKDNSNFDSDAINYLAALQLGVAKYLKLEADLEFSPDYGWKEKTLFLPQGYVLVGSLLYAGAGIGAFYYDDTWADEPFYAFRAGDNLPLGERLSIDVNANYRFMDGSALESINSDDADNITFGAILRFKF